MIKNYMILGYFSWEIRIAYCVLPYCAGNIHRTCTLGLPWKVLIFRLQFGTFPILNLSWRWWGIIKVTCNNHYFRLPLFHTMYFYALPFDTVCTGWMLRPSLGSTGLPGYYFPEKYNCLKINNYNCVQWGYQKTLKLTWGHWVLFSKTMVGGGDKAGSHWHRVFSWHIFYDFDIGWYIIYE